MKNLACLLLGLCLLTYIVGCGSSSSNAPAPPSAPEGGAAAGTTTAE